ncbi:LLM class flavin-dependent oxidoreductase [Rhizobium deserti]|uniref:LLM class flavin-dependent oxidoreductase n=1 Tax=Rhizobium deserti TaxID=2547961 RepID=A0A4R5UAT3_9HYPH|nr:LLM class flavin-dependent oxidoreductase [Rhizobium deserti]TDK32143.1 LLM class flavin-dependent oxidoreductase [Rhizobium deserti]
MLLGYSLTPFGHDPDAWTKARDRRRLGFDALLDQVAAAEAAGFDFVLLADRLGVRPVDDLSSVAVPFEPTLLASALATRADRIGIVAAASTAQHEPYNLARRFASLDLVSKGRAGWLVVPDDGDAGRGNEYVDVVTALWDSFEDDAFIYDKAAGRFFDPSKMHVAHHQGAYLAVRGPLNVNRSPQGRPVLAHLLEEGDDALAARTGELLLLQADTVEGLVAIAARMIRSVEAAGRRRSDVRLVANIVPVVAESEQALGEDGRILPIAGIQMDGTPEMIADRLQELATATDLEGFTILPPSLEMGQRFLGDVVPELGRRGLIGSRRQETLRDRLGLAQPVHPAASGKEVSA